MTHPPLSLRYEALLDALVDRTVANLRTIGVLSLAFLAIDVGALVPIATLLIHRRMRRVLVLRGSQVAVPLAVPRGLLAELARRPVHLDPEFADLEDDGEDDDPGGGGDNGGSGAGGGAGADTTARTAKANALRERRASRASVRLLLAQKLDPERVVQSWEQVVRRREKQRTHRALEAKILLPFFAWAAAVAALLGATWALQGHSAKKIEPTRVSHLMNAKTSRIIFDAAELVIEAVCTRNGSPWARNGGGARWAGGVWGGSGVGGKHHWYHCTHWHQ